MICNYRNCANDLSRVRKNAKYCCETHRINEYTYKKRDKKKELKQQELIKKIIDKK